MTSRLDWSGLDTLVSRLSSLSVCICIDLPYFVSSILVMFPNSSFFWQCTHTHTHTHTYTHTYTHLHTRTHTYTHAHTPIPAVVHFFNTREVHHDKHNASHLSYVWSLMTVYVCVCVCVYIKAAWVDTLRYDKIYIKVTPIPEHILSLSLSLSLSLCVCMCVRAHCSLISSPTEFMLLLSGRLLNMSGSVWPASYCQLQPRCVWWWGDSDDFFGSEKKKIKTGTDFTFIFSKRQKRLHSRCRWVLFSVCNPIKSHRCLMWP